MTKLDTGSQEAPDEPPSTVAGALSRLGSVPVSDDAEQETPETPDEIQMVFPPPLLAGTYANYARVLHSDYELTIDFARIDFAQGIGLFVARLNLAPMLAEQLIRVLSVELERYAEKALEVLPSVTDDEREDGGDAG